jgi:hypothetical protein
MNRVGEPSRRARLAVSAVSGGVLAMIWSGVWYAAVATRRGNTAPPGVAGYQVLFAAGLIATLVGFVYLRRRRLSVIDGSSAHHALPAAPGPARPQYLAQTEQARL